MGSNNNPIIFKDELNNSQYNNNNLTNNNNNNYKFNPLFDLESNKENNLNQANILNNSNSNNSNNNNKDKRLSVIITNSNNSFSLGLNKKPLLSPRGVLSPRNSNENIFQQPSSPQQQTTSLLEDTISNLNNSSNSISKNNSNSNEEVLPNKKHRNSQILSKNFVSLSLETDSPKHSRSTTDLNTFFHESDPDQYIYSRSKTICGGDLQSLVLDFGNNGSNNNIFTKFQNNSSNNNSNNLENFDNSNNKPTVVHSYSSNSLPNSLVNSSNNNNSMTALPSVLSSSAPSLMSLLESSSTRDNRRNSINKSFEEDSECDITVNISQQKQNISFSIDSPLKDSMCDDEDDDDSTPPTPIQRTNVNLYRSSSSILSPPLLVSSSSTAANLLLSRQSSMSFNNDQIYPSSPELSPAPPQNASNNAHNQSQDDDSPNTSVDHFGSSPYKTPSKLSSSSSFFLPSSSSPSAGSKRSRTCLDFTKYTSSIIDEEQQQQQQQSSQEQQSQNLLSSSPTNTQSSSQTTVTSSLSPLVSPRIISSLQPPLNNINNNNTTNTLNSIQQNLKQNINVPSYLNPLQRSNSISGSRPPRPLSLSMASLAPDIAAAKALCSSQNMINSKPLPFDNIPTTTNENNVHRNETQRNIIKFIEEQNKRQQQQQQQQKEEQDSQMGVNEDEIGIQEEIVDFEHEQNKPKLLACKQTQGFNSVLCETVFELLNSKSSTDALITIIDCRYDYEYLGGHIKNAINIPPIGSRQKVYDTFFKNPTKDKQHIIIFHCEFSSKRAPDCYKLFREIDRSQNCYPNVHYPEIYLLQGGYKKFYENCSSVCIGSYIRMDDKNYTSNLKEEEEKKKQEKQEKIYLYSRNFKSLKTRSHSFHI